ncbi:hypothetical protein [Thioalkalivibrio sp.]|uniref:hypothetical protein n=1 Tax=Thioalkalivibrio sp. TaxID=2093813 RepID=UPI0012D655FB|nr:hypothetical protein [Thioalkalivibrio sp.]TVP79346.1 MAG: hypothetical protein EA346_10010 [Thioalkalivibrio sp.]
MVTGNRNRTGEPRASRATPGTGALVLVGLIAVLTQATSGCAVAAVQPQAQAGSTAIVLHDSVSPVAETRVTRYRDGHKVVTRDRSGTDITIQRAPGYSVSRDAWEHPDGHSDRFDGPWVDERFRPGHGHDDSSSGGHDTATTRDAFRQRMFDRMDAAPPRW